MPACKRVKEQPVTLFTPNPDRKNTASSGMITSQQQMKK